MVILSDLPVLLMEGEQERGLEGIWQSGKVNPPQYASMRVVEHTVSLLCILACINTTKTLSIKKQTISTRQLFASWTQQPCIKSHSKLKPAFTRTHYFLDSCCSTATQLHNRSPTGTAIGYSSSAAPEQHGNQEAGSKEACIVAILSISQTQL